MSYSQMVDLLRKENKNEIVFVKTGAFYIAVEEDAVFLNKKLKLKCTCYRKNTCKVGVPIKALDKYLVKIEKLGYAYHVYSVDKEKIELNLEKEYLGKKHYTENNHINCLLCKGVNAYKDDIYLEALLKRNEQRREE